MTKNDFVSICESNGVAPSIALENERVRDLLKRDMGKNSIINQLNLNGILGQEF